MADLIFREGEKEVSQRFQQSIERVKNTIRDKIERNQLEEALMDLEEYDAMFPMDPDTYSMKAVIFCAQGMNHKGKQLLQFAFENGCINQDLAYNLAYFYEQDHEILKAIELFEFVLFNCNDDHEKETLLSKLNELEAHYSPQLEIEVLQQYDLATKLNASNGANVHLLYDSPYCEQFIQFVARHFDIKAHVFVIVTNKDQQLQMITKDSLMLEQVRRISIEENLDQLVQFTKSARCLFIHYLFDYICELICKLDLKSNLNWILWGGDLYNYIDYKMYDALTLDILRKIGFNAGMPSDKGNITYYYRKAAIRKITSILTTNDGDYQYTKQNFITAANRIDFFYSNLVDLENIPQAPPLETTKKKPMTLLLGNSAAPSNQHLEMISMLKHISNQDISVIVPLSYGGPWEYIEYVKRYAEKALGNKLNLLIDYMEPKAYFKIMDEVDIALFHHYRQQAAGNILQLIYMGKKVYMNPYSTLYNQFINMGLSIYDITSIPKLSYESFVETPYNVEKNQEILDKYYSSDRAIQLLSNVINR